MFNQLALLPPSLQLQYMMALQQQQQNMQMQQQVEEEEEEECDDEQLRTIFCANLDDRIDEELLYELFLQAGPLDSVRIPKDNNGKQRSFGFIIFTHECSAPYAMHLLKGLSLYGKTITLKYKNSTNLPPLITERIVPPHWGQQKQDPDDKPSCSQNNSALRRPNFKASNDTSADSSNSSSRDQRQSGNDWVLGRDRHRHRPHENSKPYQRNSGDGFERPSGSDRSYRSNDYQKRYAHSGNNRRPDQRSFQRL